MKIPDDLSIRDYTFRETVSCPLKMLFLLKEKYNDQRDDLFRRKTKRILRESVARQFPSIKFTSKATADAEKETETWLKEDVVSICGAVLRTGPVRARLPILLKDHDSLTVVQIHGKALKGDPSDLFNRQPVGKSIQRYLFKAAYRYHVVKSVFPNASISCDFVFPRKSYKAGCGHLYQRTQGAKELDNEALDELKELFIRIDGTRPVEELMQSIPAELSHDWFKGDSIEKAIEKVSNLDQKSIENIVQNVHMGCRNCRFRKPLNQHEKGCWDTYFPDKTIQNRDKHLFELIGHHVLEEHLIEEKYQENVTHSSEFTDADKVMKHTEKKIAIYHRKAMQLLHAKNQKLPLIFAKEQIKSVRDLEPPLHFIDFEAATHPVPAEKGKRPYDPILFQFSCHTLLGNGELIHTQWLDQDKYSSPLNEIIQGLKQIPDFENGTIIQFSPFERQALYKLFNDVKKNREDFDDEYLYLKNVLRVGEKDQKIRFMDISVLLKDAYYNRFMNSGLSLKEILYSVLQAEDELNTFKKKHYEIEGVQVNLFEKKDGKLIDPYYQLSDKRSQIRDGITAMHAYLCMKAGVLSDTQKTLVPVMLKRYCSMDSLGVFLIYHHITNLVKMNKSDGDLVIHH